MHACCAASTAWWGLDALEGILWNALCLRPCFTLNLWHCLQALHGGSQHELAKEALGQAVDLFRASSSLDPEAVVNSERLRTSIDEALNAPRPVEGEEE